MPGFGILKKLTGRKTLGRRNRRMQNEEEDDEYMGFGLIDSAIDLRHELTDTTGVIGSRWKKGESMIGKFMNKQPETWPPEPTAEEPLNRRRHNRQSDLDAIRQRRLQLQEGREQLPRTYDDQIALEPNLLMI